MFQYNFTRDAFYQGEKIPCQNKNEASALNFTKGEDESYLEFRKS